MKAMRGMMVAAAIVTWSALADGAETKGVATSERAYVLTHSSLLDGACYDTDRKELTLFFRTGAAYVYSGVPEELFRDFVRSVSPGHFYHERLRGKFLSRRLSERDLAALIDRHDGRTSW